jgi:hypothetical protein
VKKRWFILNDGFLFYFEKNSVRFQFVCFGLDWTFLFFISLFRFELNLGSLQQPNLHPKGIIDLEYMTLVYDGVCDMGLKKKESFLSTPLEYTMVASEAPEARKWMRYLRKEVLFNTSSLFL